MLIQCVVEREGNEHLTRLENRRYQFKRNDNGNMVCEVSNKEHIKWMLSSSSYREYLPPEEKKGNEPEMPPEETEVPKGETEAKKAKKRVR